MLTTPMIDKMVIESIIAYTKAIQESAIKTRILTYLETEPVPIVLKQQIEDFLTILPIPTNIDNICQLIEKEVITIINTALREAIHISIQDIANKLVGSYSFKDIIHTTELKLKSLTEKRIREEGKSVDDENILIVITRDQEG
jgi:hypothetical protein